jgi:hypothetical protein
MKPVIPDELIAEVSQRNAVVFVGAGLSAGLGLPDWPQLIQQMIYWCPSQGINLPNKTDIEHLLNVRKNLPDAVAALRAKMGNNKYCQFLEEVFLHPNLRPTEVHKILSRIPFAGAITTNYDALVEEGYKEVHPGETFPVFTHVDYEHLGTVLNTKKYFVLKAHGTIERPETIILDSADYKKLIHRSPGYRTFLHALFLDRTVLFLGFSMTDRELLLLLEGLNEIFDGHTPTHYALMDVRDTLPTEQELFEENFSVKVIPYTPSAVNHPEVKSFLIELLEKMRRQAFSQQKEQAREAARGKDPHYDVFFTTDDQFFIKEKYPGAAEEKPLTLSFTVKGREAVEAVKRLEETGEPLAIKGEHIVNVTLPDIISRHIQVTGHRGITTGVARGDMKRTVKATVECADGETASLDNIILEDIQSGTKQAVLSNENQNVPWKFRMIIKADDDEASVNFTFNDVGLPIKRALEGLRFSRALSKGGILRIENVETGEQFAHADITPGSMPAPNPLLIRVLEALDIIQRKTGYRFTSPQDVPEPMVQNIFAVEQILQTGRIEFRPPYVLTARPEAAKDTLEKMSKGLTGSITQYADDWVFVVLGQHVSLGPVLVICETMTITPEDAAVLRKAIESSPADAVVEVPMTPVAGKKIEAKLPNWLPAEEAEKIRNHPFARMVALKNLISLLFESAHINKDTLDFKEFLSLLDNARSQTSEQGLPLNPLSTATPEELIEAFEPVAGGLEPKDSLRLARNLFNQGWLPQSDAARLAGVEEETFKRAASAIPKLTALEAQGAANLFLSDHLGDRFLAVRPQLDELGDLWRLHVVLTYAVLGPVGEVGEVVVSSDVEEIVSHTPIEEMKECARALYQQHRDQIEAPLP